MSKKVIIIGSGFSGLSSACFLAKAGFDVTILEKNSSIGGRARQFQAQGFTFDMGPSWYWMPDVFERFFGFFGKKSSDFYQLTRLDPSYKVVWDQTQHWDIPASLEELYLLFESVEPGSSQKLKSFLAEAEYKYNVGIGKFVHLPGKSLLEYVDSTVIKALFKLHLLTDMSTYIKKYFKDSRIVRLLEFPVLFLGERPSHTPALYSLMNYADIVLGTWYPMGGMYEIVKAMETIALNLGVKFYTNQEVINVSISNNTVMSVETIDKSFPSDYVVGSADYNHIDSKILPKEFQQYDSKYWENRKMAPSSLLYYLGINKKVSGLLHHNLFFDADFNLHADEIYKNPSWTQNPLFYVSVPSMTDFSVAPQGMENMFILIPTAPGLIENKEISELYFNKTITRIENKIGIKFKDNIVYRRDFAASNFIADYHAHKGNAYGLANTLLQTGPLKPTMIHKKLSNFVFTGQLTVPGPGVPPSFISGELSAKEIINMEAKKK